MKDIIFNLELLLKQKNPTLNSHLNEGASSSEIVFFFKKYLLDISVHSDLFYLYAWHDGTNLNENEHCLTWCLFPDYYLMSMKEIEETISTDNYYNFRIKKLIPIFASCGGDYLVINTEEFNSQKGYKIHYCSPRITNEANHLSIFDSLINLMKSILECYKKNYYFINPNDNILDEKFEEVRKIQKSLNPQSSYWSSNEII